MNIQEKLEQHKAWLKTDGGEGERFKASKADLNGADLFGANLKGADFSFANLTRHSIVMPTLVLLISLKPTLQKPT